MVLNGDYTVCTSQTSQPHGTRDSDMLATEKHVTNHARGRIARHINIWKVPAIDK